MNTHYLQQLSFHKLENHPSTASLHSFVLVRNSLLESIRTQQQQDSWLDACFDELAPESNTTNNNNNSNDTTYLEEQDSSIPIGSRHDTEHHHEEAGMDDIDMLLLEGDEDDDLSDDDNGPVSPEQSTLFQQPDYQARPFGSPAFFIPMDDDDDEDDDDDDVDDDIIDDSTAFMATTTTTTLLPLTPAINDHPCSSSKMTKQVLGTRKGKFMNGDGNPISGTGLVFPLDDL